MTTIAATILMGDCGDVVMDAIASVVEQVDLVICIDTVPSGEKNPSMALARLAAKEKFRPMRLRLHGEGGFVKTGWDGSFGNARNFALHVAGVLHADWALTLDTDERIAWGDLALRATLDTNPEYDVYLLWRDDGHYAKERVFRIPSKGEWVGRTHEAFILTANNHRPVLPYATFRELDKTPEQLAAKFARDEVALRAEIEQHPHDARWHFYLGATLHDTGRYQEAASTWGRVARMPGWDEQAAWAAYQAATIYGDHLHNWPIAAQVAGIGLARMITPELCWYLGYACHRLGRYREAILWGEQALAATRGPARIFFRWMPAWQEKPYELLHFAHQALGNQHEAQTWGSLWAQAREGVPSTA